MPTSSIKADKVVKKFLLVLPDRTRDILTKRFGLEDEARKMTLESIGQQFGITRERVRQIENFALNSIRKADVFEKEAEVFHRLQNEVDELGGVVAEKELLDSLSSNDRVQNHYVLLLTLGDQFKREKENDEFHHRWTVNEEVANKVYEALRKLHKSLDRDSLISESEFLSRFTDQLHTLSLPRETISHDAARRWLKLSKQLDSNQLGEWGSAASPNINARGMRDYAYLVIRRHGSPMHFTEVAQSITDLFGRKAHVATCHNELIKDDRFVLVGRGLYVLSEWGYTSGVVRDVIRDILDKHGPLSKDDIVEKVSKERYVKPNTIIVNLQNNKYFKKDKDGKYVIVK